MDVLLQYLKAFAVGGLLCVIGQLLIDYTKLTPARILTSYVVAGVILGALGIYQPLADWAGAGANVPLTGFGNAIAKGVKKAVAEDEVLCGAWCRGVLRTADIPHIQIKGQEQIKSFRDGCMQSSRNLHIIVYLISFTYFIFHNLIHIKMKRDIKNTGCSCQFTTVCTRIIFVVMYQSPRLMPILRATWIIG